ncbi:MAG: glycosyltransferase, partial [Gammaproteobacteria bacterium]|nr:glycosyltransferase [Gammaproteobacteria bacterium]
GQQQQPLVSIVMAAYNSAPYMPEAISSVINQSYPHWELHIINDGSKDNTAEVVRPFLTDARIIYHEQENKGQASAKNCGLRAARGEFIAFLDADDKWSADKLEKQLPVFAAHPEAGLVHTNVMLITESGEPLGSPQRSYPQGWISGDLLIDNRVNGMASILRRECLEQVGIFDESLSMGIDYDLWLRVSARYQILFLDEVTYFYRQWAGQMSHRYEERMDNAIRIMQKFLRDHPGVVPESVVKTAWAHTFVGRGYSRFRADRRWSAAMSDYLRALGYRPTYLPAWKAIIKLLIWRS